MSISSAHNDTLHVYVVYSMANSFIYPKKKKKIENVNNRIDFVLYEPVPEHYTGRLHHLI